MESDQPPVVVGIDGAASGAAALRHALRLADKRGTGVNVVHCWEPDADAGLTLERHSASHALLQSEIQHAVAALGSTAQVPPLVPRSVPGRAATTLLRASSDAAELVLGASGRSHLHDVVFGEIIATCLRSATVPVTVVDSDGTVVSRVSPALTG